MPLHDGAPWDETERGSLNPSSHAAHEVFTLVRMAMGVLTRSEYAITPKSVRAMTGTLAHILDATQSDLTGTADRQVFSHARLREALESALETMPYPPLYSDVQEMDAWVLRMVKRVNSIAAAAVALWADGAGERPWAQLWDTPAPAPN